MLRRRKAMAEELKLPPLDMRLIFKHFPKGEGRLIRTVWKDGIDMAFPSYGMQSFAEEYGRACYIAGLQEAAEICCPTNKRAEQHTSISVACARDIEARIAHIKARRRMGRDSGAADA